jgi:hypothetical protein
MKIPTTTITRGEPGTIKRGVRIIGVVELPNDRRARLRRDGKGYIILEIGPRFDADPRYLEEVEQSISIRQEYLDSIVELFQQARS